MEFMYNDDGTWTAFTDEGTYEIEVCDDGRFIGSYLHDELGKDETQARTEVVYTLQQAKNWCERHAMAPKTRVVLS